MVYLVFIIGLALLFDIINGFHDAANSIATVVSTKVLSPGIAVIWAAFFNFIAYLVFGLHVANTIGKGIIHPEVATLDVIFACLIGSIIWNLITWWYGIPNSSSHALIGGLVGSAVAAAGFHSIFFGTILIIIAFIFLAPLIGMVVAVLLSTILLHIFKKVRPSKVDHYFRRLQLVSAAAYSLGHGANDAQKTMGLIYVTLISAHKLSSHAPIPLWIVLACQGAMAIGTMAGGWRIVKTMGQRITHLVPFEGFSAETAGALTLFGASLLGIPVSTTHTITGSIIGTGALKRASAVHWGVTLNLLWAWIITIPVTALLSALIYYLITLIH